MAVATVAPEVDDLLAVVIGTAGAAKLAAVREVLGERVAHGFESAADVAFDGYSVQCGDGHHGS